MLHEEAKQMPLARASELVWWTQMPVSGMLPTLHKSTQWWPILSNVLLWFYPHHHRGQVCTVSRQLSLSRHIAVIWFATQASSSLYMGGSPPSKKVNYNSNIIVTSLSVETKLGITPLTSSVRAVSDLQERTQSLKAVTSGYLVPTSGVKKNARRTLLLLFMNHPNMHISCI